METCVENGGGGTLTPSMMMMIQQAMHCAEKKIIDRVLVLF